jgi:hypothetical protein
VRESPTGNRDFHFSKTEDRCKQNISKASIVQQDLISKKKKIKSRVLDGGFLPLEHVTEI